jgi:hypothetical protein
MGAGYLILYLIPGNFNNPIAVAIPFIFKKIYEKYIPSIGIKPIIILVGKGVGKSSRQKKDLELFGINKILEG